MSTYKKRAVLIAFLATVVVLLSFFFTKVASKEIEVLPPIPPAEASSTPPLPTLSHRQMVWMYVLEWCESRGKSDIKILDSNGKYSYGSFQFQMSTFLSYGKKYGFIDENVDSTEGEKLIYDYSLQKNIAQRMLSDGLEYHWKMCYRKIGEKYPKD